MCPRILMELQQNPHSLDVCSGERTSVSLILSPKYNVNINVCRTRSFQDSSTGNKLTNLTLQADGPRCGILSSAWSTPQIWVNTWRNINCQTLFTKHTAWKANMPWTEFLILTCDQICASYFTPFPGESAAATLPPKDRQSDNKGPSIVTVY